MKDAVTTKPNLETLLPETSGAASVRNFLFSQRFIFLACGLSALLGLALDEALPPYYRSILVYSGVHVLLAVSLNLVIGIAGQFSMGHAGFMAVGAYTSSFLAMNVLPRFLDLTDPVTAFLSFPFLLFSSGFMAALFGVLVGLPTLRLRGDYLAIVTLGFGEIIRVMILNIDVIGGARGLPGVPQMTTLAWLFFVIAICVTSISRLMGTTHGRALLAVREDETAAEAVGIHTTRYKVTAFVMGAFFAGVAGSFFAHFLTYINPSIFDFNKGFEIIIMVVLGGLGSTTGAILAALFLTISKEALRPLQEITHIDLRMILFSLMLILLMLLRPNGFLGNKELKDFFPKRKGSLK